MITKAEFNFIMVSDGAARGSTGSAAAAWAVLAARDSSFILVAVGAQILEKGTSSLDAEVQALHLAIQAFLRLARESVIICPHKFDRLIQRSELSGDVLTQVRCT